MSSFRTLIDALLDAGVHGIFAPARQRVAAAFNRQPDVVMPPPSTRSLAGCQCWPAASISPQRGDRRATRARELGGRDRGVPAVLHHARARDRAPPSWSTMGRVADPRVRHPVGHPRRWSGWCCGSSPRSGAITALKDSSGRCQLPRRRADNRDLPDSRLHRLRANRRQPCSWGRLSVPGPATRRRRIRPSHTPPSPATGRQPGRSRSASFPVRNRQCRCTGVRPPAAAHGAFKVALWLQGLIEHPDTAHLHTPPRGNYPADH